MNVSKELESIGTDEKGSFSFEALPREGDYSVKVMGFGQRPSTHVVPEPDPVHPNQLKVPPVKFVVPNLKVAGRVVGPDDTPVPGLPVSVGHSGAMTDVDGCFVFSRAGAGSRGSEGQQT